MTGSRVVIPIAGLSSLLVVAMLYWLAPMLYYHLASAMIKVPGTHLFTDLEWLPSAVLCWSRGVNVYVNNTCYFHQGLGFNYSPVWLRLSFLIPLGAWVNQLAIAICVLFFLSPAVLPTARPIRDQIMILLTTLSCATFLAMERANADLIMYLMILCAVLFLHHDWPLRITGYGLIISAALLKFYPIVVLVLACRERFGILVLVGLAALISLGTVTLLYPEELVWMARNLSYSSYYTLQFGATDLPVGLVAAAQALTGLSPPKSASPLHIVELLLRATLPVLAVGAAFYIARRFRFVEALAAMPNEGVDSLIAGAVIICGCFFLGQSVIYRAIFLLLSIPGLLLLEKQVPVKNGAKLIGGVCVAGCFVLWTPLLETVLAALKIIPHRLPYQSSRVPDSAPAYLLWLAYELAWWFIVTVLLALIGSFLSASGMVNILKRLLKKVFNIFHAGARRALESRLQLWRPAYRIR